MLHPRIRLLRWLWLRLLRLLRLLLRLLLWLLRVLGRQPAADMWW